MLGIFHFSRHLDSLKKKTTIRDGMYIFETNLFRLKTFGLSVGIVINDLWTLYSDKQQLCVKCLCSCNGCQVKCIKSIVNQKKI